MNYLLNMREVSYALSEALDYVGIDDTMHGKRVAFMAAEVAKKLAWPEERIDEIIMTGMLHDCGVSSTDVHSHLVNELDWDNSQVHCVRGGSLLEKVSIYKRYVPAVRYHHTHWNELPDSLDPSVQENANLIYLVDRVDALRVQIGDANMQERDEIGKIVAKYAGSMFSPGLVDTYLECAQTDSFWFYMEAEPLNGYFDEWIEKGGSEEVSFECLKNIATMFADVVDAKSTFTAEHSYSVASVAKCLSRLMGLSQKQEETIVLAALLHDLGKLRVADAILYKPGPLNEEERHAMNRHGFDSQMILRKISGMKEISRIASLHHEHLDASGYPYHLRSEQIPIEVRVLTVADIFQALIQDRPYRSGLSAQEALEILEKMGSEGKIDSEVVACVAANLQECYLHAWHTEKL